MSIKFFSYHPETASVRGQAQEQPERPEEWEGTFVSTAEWDAVDPLGGILNSNWDERKEAADAAAARPAVRRAFSRFVVWLKADPPNMSDGDIRLDVDPKEPRIPLEQRLKGRQLQDFRESADPSQDMTPDPTNFYDHLLRPLGADQPKTPR